MKGSAILDAVERAGNRLPHPTMLFVYMCGMVLLASAVASLFGASAVSPVSGETVTAVNLLSADGLHRILTQTVANFVSFAPVGPVLVAIMGIGVAEHSGLLNSFLRATILKAPPQYLSFFAVLAGVLSNIAMDAGYVVLIPLAGLVFYSAGRHPLAGIAAAFAGVSGGFSANLLITPTDALLAGLSTEAAVLIDSNYIVNAAANYYFLIASTLLIALVGTLVTERIVVPRLPAQSDLHHAGFEPLNAQERRGLRAAGLFALGFLAIVLIGLVPAQGFLRDPATGSILASPFIHGIITVIAVFAGLAGIVYGRASGRYRRSSEFITGMEDQMATMATYLVLMFFAAQFVSYFAWSNLGLLVAIKGAAVLAAVELPAAVLFVVFILMVTLINIFVGSASAKWALIGPVFIPMFMLIGITPEATQMAYRIADSSTNIITPLMPYYGVVIAFAQRYNKDVGLGTLIAMMLPYSIAFLLFWSVLFLLWTWLGWPLGPAAPVFLE